MNQILIMILFEVMMKMKMMMKKKQKKRSNNRMKKPLMVMKKKKQMNNVEDDVDDKEETRTNHLISNMTKSNMIQTSIPKKQPDEKERFKDEKRSAEENLKKQNVFLHLVLSRRS